MHLAATKLIGLVAVMAFFGALRCLPCPARGPLHSLLGDFLESLCGSGAVRVNRSAVAIWVGPRTPVPKKDVPGPSVAASTGT